MDSHDPRREESEPRRALRLSTLIPALPILFPVAILLVLAITMVVIVATAYTFRWEWTGFLGKTLRDWMELLIVPIILALGGLLLTQMDRVNTRMSQELDRLRLEQDREQAREERHLGQERQVTDLFTRTIDQLGATTTAGDRIMEVRVGAIYALERIARASPRDLGQIMEIMTSYVRQHAHRREGENRTPDDATPFDAPPLAPDIQAILTVLGRRPSSPDLEDRDYLDLHETDLRGAELEGVNLERAYLREANLRGAYLREQS